MRDLRLNYLSAEAAESATNQLHAHGALHRYGSHFSLIIHPQSCNKCCSDDMETAPLTLAHTHARNAALETKRSNPVAASEEHDLAAAEFAAAAQLTRDREALRILNLLELHHKKLGQILKSRHTTTIQDGPPTTSPAHDSSATPSSQPAISGRSTSPETVSQPPRLVRTSRAPGRDLSSSIASNLASARGIPNARPKRPTPISPMVSNQHADGRFLQDEDNKHDSNPGRTARSKSDGGDNITSGRPSWAPPSDIVENGSSSPAKPHSDPTAADAPFQQFYTTFETLISKLSAPLAFAGLPLASQSTPPSPSPSAPSKVQTASQRPPPSPSIPKPLEASINYSQLISQAALRAVSRNTKSPPYGNPSESFYVVPTTGGTTSYAEIMTRADREASHHRRNLSSGTADDFVDASSTILPPVPENSRRVGTSNEKKYDGKTMEELSLENKALKHLSDTLSKRLHVFEMSAQTSSAALAQSIRSLHLSPLHTPENSRGKSTTTIAFSPDSTHGTSASNNVAETAQMKARITELEKILEKSDAKAKKREEENAKLRDTIIKYRDKWDSLKAGAKARRERATGEAAEGRRSGNGKEKERSSNDLNLNSGPEKAESESAGDGTSTPS